MLIVFDNSGVAIGLNRAFGFALVYGEVAAVAAAITSTPAIVASGFSGAGRFIVPESREDRVVIRGRGSIRIRKADIFGQGRIYDAEPDYSLALQEDEEFLMVLSGPN